MTTLQLAQRALSFTALAQDPASVPADQAAVVVGAMNAGMSKYYLNAPSGRKTTPVTYFLKPPRNYQSISLTQGSSAFSGVNDLQDDDIGDTLYVSGRKCPLAIGSNMREPWPGQTGVYPGVIYDDAVPMYSPIRRIEGSVIFNEQHRLDYISEVPIVEDEVVIPKTSNTPQFYSIENLGDVVGGAVRGLIRIYPFPTQPSTLRFSASLEPQQFTILSMSSAFSLYVNNLDVEAFVVPLIAAELAQTTVWNPSIDRASALLKGKETEAYLRTYHEPSGPNMSRVLTPSGY
ncbi:MAG: hypothetical protein EBU96_07510 [Actinobacteria bacterium]|nr:hypothetical protein [Actinomycetota bacterium]